MAKIYGLGGIPLVLPDSFSLSFNVVSGWEIADINYDIIYPFTIPLRANQKALGILSETSLPINYNQIEGLFDDEFNIVKCIISLQNVNEFEDEVEISVIFNGVEIDTLGKNIREIDMPVSGSISTQYSNGINQIWPATPVYFPFIKNERFYDDPNTEDDRKNNPTFQGYLNGHNVITGSFIENFQDFSSGEIVNRNSLVPCVAIKEVIQRCFQISGYSVDGSWWRDTNMNRLFTYNNTSLDSPEVQAWEDFTAFNSKNTLLFRTQQRGPGGIVTTSNLSYFVEFTSTDQPSVVNITSGSNTRFSVPGIGVFAATMKLKISAFSPASIGQRTVLLKTEFWDTDLSIFTTELTPIDIPQIVGSPNSVITITGVFQRPTLTGSANANFEIRQSLEFVGTPLSGNVRVSVDIQEFTVRRVFEVPLIRFAAITNLANHLPDLSFADFINEIIKQFTLRWRINEVDKVFYLDYALPEVNSVGNPFVGKVIKNGSSISFDPIRKIAIRYSSGDEDHRGGEYEAMYRIFPVLENGEFSFRNAIFEENYDQIIELGTHPIPREYSWTPSSEVFEEGISVPLQVNGSLSPMRLAFYVGIINNTPRSDSAIGGLSFFPSAQGSSFLRVLLNFIFRLKADPRIYFQPVVFSLGEYVRFDRSKVIEINGNKFICISIDGERKEGVIEAVMTLRRV